MTERCFLFTGIDNYGCGRFPTYFEPVVLFAITDSTSVADIPPDFRDFKAYPTSSTVAQEEWSCFMAVSYAKS
ncbi:hypothetical protein ANCDUO_11924 [Ancylostoma duodenale]|uniref:Uncharacterized protein n=1 Tax=Ancylostoma duodenale TaxID=51022 RepID=A0A0C2D722_9BILA|nr:hypothetical protein ANCDUO_11924 [Ancylostoma duodenale]